MIVFHDLWIWFVINVIDASNFDQIPKIGGERFVTKLLWQIVYYTMLDHTSLRAALAVPESLIYS